MDWIIIVKILGFLEKFLPFIFKKKKKEYTDETPGGIVVSGGAKNTYFTIDGKSESVIDFRKDSIFSWRI